MESGQGKHVPYPLFYLADGGMEIPLLIAKIGTETEING